MQREDGLTIAASMYGSTVGEPRPAILLLHGNTPYGRKLGFYKVLGRKLGLAGYFVLVIDFTGFGESDDPFRLGRREAVDKDKDVIAALDYLRSLPAVAHQQIFLVGHSMGASSALSVGVKDPGVRGICLIGPPRRRAERLSNAGQQDYFWKRERESYKQVYGKHFPDWYSRELWLEQRLGRDMMNHLDSFRNPGHRPLLLMDSELESNEDKAFLEAYYRAITEPKNYLTIKNSDHYSNVVRIPWLAIYDSEAVEDTVTSIQQWISGVSIVSQSGDAKNLTYDHAIPYVGVTSEGTELLRFAYFSR